MKYFEPKNDNYSKQDDSNPTVHMEEINQYELDPPRALPDTEPLPQPMPYQRTQATQSQEVRTGETYVGEEEGLDEEYDFDFQVWVNDFTCEYQKSNKNNSFKVKQHYDNKCFNTNIKLIAIHNVNVSSMIILVKASSWHKKNVIKNYYQVLK